MVLAAKKLARMSKELIGTYQQFTKRKRLFIFASALLLLVFIFFGLLVGSSDISLWDMLTIFTGNSENVQLHILFNIRLPRVLSAVLAGTALSISGTVMQSILRNPLGSPFTLGISNAAAFGAAFAIIFLGAGTSQSNSSDAILISNPYIITLSAFFWSLFSTIIILLMARFKDASPETMILTGIIMGSLFIAGTTGLEYFAEDTQLSTIVFWTFGDLGRASWTEFYILLAIVTPALFFFLQQRWNIRSLNTGDETANSLGVNVEKTRMRVMLVASLTTAVTVSFFGIIAFVGLVVPHLVRKMIGSDERFLIPATALFGSVFLLASDLLARTIIAPMVLPVGILTSFIGAPLFIFLLFKSRGKSVWLK